MFLADFHIGRVEVVTHQVFRSVCGVRGGREVDGKGVFGARKMERGGIVVISIAVLAWIFVLQTLDFGHWISRIVEMQRWMLQEACALVCETTCYLRKPG